MNYFTFLLLSALLFTKVESTNAQKTEEVLALHVSKTAHLDAGQINQYSFFLQKGQYASLKVYQKSIGIGFAVYDPGDSLIISGDLNDLYQTEIITLTAHRAGKYRIDIFWDYDRPQSGDYSIVWSLLENSGKTASLRAEQLMKSWYPKNQPGAAVVVLKNNKIIFKSLKGLANAEYKIPVSDSSVFDLASCSKQFTGFAIAMLIDKGSLSLQDDILIYLPELPVFGKKITVGHLLYHTSGLRNWDEMSYAMGLQPEDVLGTDMIFKMIGSNTKLNYLPNDKFLYSNTGYSLLALIIERVTHTKFADWMAANIFIPLEMNNTVVRDDITRIIPNKVYSYKNNKEGLTVNPDNISAFGSSSVYSSIQDLAKWVANFSQRKVGSEKVFALLNTKTTLNNGDSLNFYSFGNGFGNYKGIASIEHLGLVSGFRTAIYRFPEQQLAIIFLSNDNNNAAYTHCLDILNLFLQYKKELHLPALNYPDLKESLTSTMPFKADKCPVGTSEYEGLYYAKEINSHYKLVNKEGTLVAISYRFDNIELKWDKPDIFSGNFSTAERRVEFVRDSNKLINAFKLTVGNSEILFTKLK